MTKICDIFPTEMIWFDLYMQIVFFGDNIYAMSIPILWEQIKYFRVLSAKH